MSALTDLSSRIIDERITDEPVNRITNELSELTDRMSIVESFSHCVLYDSDDGLIAFDASGANTGGAVVGTIAGWTDQPVRHLAYTHGHVDHIGGSRHFAERWGDDIAVIGHENVGRRIDRYVETSGYNIAINTRQFGGVSGKMNLAISAAPDDDGPGDDRADGGDPNRWRNFVPHGTLRPNVEFAERHEYTAGDETIELNHARGETDDHLWAWIPSERAIIAGDFLIWQFPNAGNPQKVQRYPREWAAALRDMAAKQPDLIVPAHGLPIGGADRIATVLTTIAGTLEQLVDDVIARMNEGVTLDEIIHTVSVPGDTLALPYMRPLYDEPEFVIRNIWRMYGGWWDLAPSRLKPASDADVGAVIAELSGGADELMRRAAREADAGNLRLACHLADFAGWAAPDEPAIHAERSRIYWERRKRESSLMAKGIFAAAARESDTVAGTDQGNITPTPY